MRAVIQRVSSAAILINSSTERYIKKGLVVLVAVEEEDNLEDLHWLVPKIINMRIFADSDDKMNLSLQDVRGDMLIVSQFTLYGSTKKGNRPSFIKSAKPEKAIPLYNEFVIAVKKEMSRDQLVETGEFGADMKVTIVNDGPVTIIIDTKLKE
jgi:D-aminoacyl-tRNA deacylase